MALVGVVLSAKRPQRVVMKTDKGLDLGRKLHAATLKTLRPKYLTKTNRNLKK